MLFATNEAHSFPSHSTAIKNEIGHSISVYRMSERGLPFNHSQDKNAPIYKATPSFSAQSSTYIIRLPQQGLYLVQSLFEIKNSEKQNIGEPSVILCLLMIFYRDIISPNAP